MSWKGQVMLRARGWRSGPGVVVATAAGVFAALAAFGALAAWYAAAAFAIVAVAALRAAPADEPERGGRAAAEPNERAADLLGILLSGLPDPVIALDGTGCVLALNEGARSLAPALRRGGPASLALRMPELIEAMRRCHALAQEQRVRYSERVPRERWLEAIITPLWREAKSGRPDLVLMTFHDLTPLRRVEEMRADFVANASHELRTPLAALCGFIETLQGPAREDAKARERFLAIMSEQARRMARLIDDLLSLSRIELDAHRRPDTPANLGLILRIVVDGLEALARSRGVTIHVAAADTPSVRGDPDELARVFENLIENALKYGAAGKRVDVTVSDGLSADGEPEVAVSVRDYGPGIAPEHLPRLTERFYRVDVGESRAQGGTGLGLALVKHILNRHRGRLTIESTPGAGATFTVHLPAAPHSPS